MAQATVEFDHAIFYVYATYAVIVLLKMIAMSFMTFRTRKRTGARTSPEDYVLFNEKMPEKWPIYDPDVAGVRKCHRNDLENIPPFLIIGFLYIFAHPSLYAATMHYRVFAFSRIFHMIAYLTPLPQPSRGIAFMVGVAVTVSMGVQTLLTIGSF